MKKSKKVTLLATLAFISLPLVSCGENTTPSTSDKQTSNSEFVETKYEVSFTKADFIQVETTGLEENKALPGSEVIFTVHNTNEQYAISSIDSNDISLKKDGDNYSFIMPRKDVKIAIKTESLGDSSILDVKNVDLTSVPTTVNGFKEYFEKAMAVEGTYFSTGHVTNHNFSGMTAYYDYQITAGKDDVLLIQGQKKSYDSDTFTTFDSEERGKNGNIYYTIKSSSGISSSSSSLDSTYTFKDIVKDEVENVSLTQIKESDAKASYTTYGGASFIYNIFFSDSASEKLYDKTDSIQMYNNYLTDVKKSLSADKKTIDYSLQVINKTYSDVKVTGMKFTFDGDYFLHSAEIQKMTYNLEDFDDTAFAVKDEAFGTLSGSYSLSFNRGYKNQVEKTDITKFGMDDYDVDISYNINAEDHPTTKDAIVVDNGSILSFSYMGKDQKPALVLPYLKGVLEEGYYDLDKNQVLKEGVFTLVFDNGFGKEKQIKVTSKKPAAHNLVIRAPSKVYLNETSTLDVKVAPLMADQDVTVTTKDGSTGAVEVSKNEDGTYSIKGTKLGQVTLVIAATSDNSIKEEVTLNVIEKPNAAAIKANLTSKTFYGESSSFKAVVNFEENGKGTYKTASNGYYSYYESEASFDWTFDENTLTFTISGAEGSYSTNRGFKAVEAVSAEELTATFTDYSYYGSTDFVLTLNAQERKSLSDFE